MHLASQLSLYSTNPSEAESERILAVGGIKQHRRHVPRIRDPPDLDPAEQETRIRHQLECVRDRLGNLLQFCAPDPQERTEEHSTNIELLRKQLRNIRKRQENLRYKLVMSKRKQQKMRSDGRSAASSSLCGSAASIRMEELRDLNRNALSVEELRARDFELQCQRSTTVSGGLLGFKVAADLRKMDFRDLDASADQFKIQQ